MLLHSRCMLTFKSMSTSPHRTIVIEPTTPAAETCIDDDSASLQRESPTNVLNGDRLLVAQAMSLLIHLDRDLREARAQFNQDWFRRIMRARPHAVSRLRRRWSKIVPQPRIALGSLRRRYHANLAKYLYGS